MMDKKTAWQTRNRNDDSQAKILIYRFSTGQHKLKKVQFCML